MNTKVTLAGIELKNPVMTCSGTFGSGMEFGESIDLNKLGAVVTKGVQLISDSFKESVLLSIANSVEKEEA